MGGAFTALGGDLTSLAYNPAGVGVYRSDEFTLTPNMQFSSTNSTYLGNHTDDNRYQFGWSNIGGVGVISTRSDVGLVSINVGAVYNKHNNFSERYAVRGNPVSMGSTYLDYFAEVANHEGLGNAEAKMAWDTYLIDTVRAGIFTPNSTAPQLKDRRVGEVHGDIGEYDFSIGGNVSNMFYFGISVGVQDIEYTESLKDISEGVGTSDFAKSTYSREYNMTGVGYNFKVGLIVRPFVDNEFLEGLRVGAALHTPTFISMTDKYDASILAEYARERLSAKLPAVSAYDYNIETPLKVMGGLAYSFGTFDLEWRGLISADYEYVDYSTIKMRNGGDGYDFDTENQAIEEGYRGVSNIRIGGELGHYKMAFRAGFAMYGNPYGNSVKDASTYFYSAGIGYRSTAFFTDFTYSLMTQKDRSYLYRYANISSDEVAYSIYQHNFVLTFGIRF
jgi:hypothetical protein